MPVNVPIIRRPSVAAPTGIIQVPRPVQVARALPPPPLTSAGGRYTQFADEFAAQQAEIARQMPTPARELANEFMHLMRRTNITAGLPAHIRPPVWNNPVDLSETVTVPAGVQADYQVGVTFRVPAGYGLRVEQYGINVLDAAYTYDGSILWAWRVNGQMLDQGMSDWGEQRGSMIFPRKTSIVVWQEEVNVDFMYRRAVAAGAPQDVQMGFRGWTWRKRNNFEGTQASVTAY